MHRPSVLESQIEEIKKWQQERVEQALNAWENSKRLLEQAIANVEAQEREYSIVASDVQQKIEMLETVAALGQEMDSQTGPETSAREIPERGTPPAIVTRSRPLFGSIGAGVPSAQSRISSIVARAAKG
jgi:hypothetical protein